MHKVIISFYVRNISWIIKFNLNFPCGAIQCAVWIISSSGWCNYLNLKNYEDTICSVIDHPALNTKYHLPIISPINLLLISLYEKQHSIFSALKNHKAVNLNSAH